MEKGPEASVAGEEPTAREWKDMSIFAKAKYMVKNTTVEPIGAFYFMPSILASLATQNLNLEKACYVNLKYEEEVCKALSARQTENYKKQEVDVQQLVASMITWKNVVQSAIPAVLILFLGAWSDRHRRRKPLILLPILGELLTCIGLLFCTYFFYELPMEVAGVVEGLFPAITGGWCTMFMAIYSYIGDITTVSMRTVRIGFVSVFVHVGIPVGMALSGFLYKNIGFYGVFSTSATLYVLIFTYIFFRIKEGGGAGEGDAEESEAAEGRDARGRVCCASLRDCADVTHVGDTFRALHRYRGTLKAQLVAVMVCGMLVIGPIHGEMAVMYLFTRYRFNWNEVDFSIFSTYSMITNLFGTMVSVGVFSHMLKIDDALIGVMSCMSKILSCFVYAFATTDWMIYLAPIVEILNGTSFIAMRSIISKLVPADELGKVNSLFGVCEALMPLVYGPMYSAVYTSTIHTLPGAFFLLGGALTMPAVLMFLWMYMVHKRENRRLGEEQAAEAAGARKGCEPAGASIAAAAVAIANGRVDPCTFVPPSLTADADLKKTSVPAPASALSSAPAPVPAADAGVVNSAFVDSADDSPPPLAVPTPAPAPAPALAIGAVNKAYEGADDKV